MFIETSLRDCMTILMPRIFLNLSFSVFVKGHKTTIILVIIN
jgi:hypothetical protein